MPPDRPSHKVPREGFLTVLKENMQATLSHSVSSFGSHPRRFPMARASDSRRSIDSWSVKVFPVKPQVNGFLLLAIGWRPYFSVVINSEIWMLSGGSDRQLEAGILFLLSF